jgi:REP element-mobilizing transposase RayT
MEGVATPMWLRRPSFISTCGGASLETVKKYIQEQ